MMKTVMLCALFLVSVGCTAYEQFNHSLSRSINPDLRAYDARQKAAQQQSAPQQETQHP